MVRVELVQIRFLEVEFCDVGAASGVPPHREIIGGLRKGDVVLHFHWELDAFSVEPGIEIDSVEGLDLNPPPM